MQKSKTKPLVNFVSVALTYGQQQQFPPLRVFKWNATRNFAFWASFAYSL